MPKRPRGRSATFVHLRQLPALVRVSCIDFHFILELTFLYTCSAVERSEVTKQTRNQRILYAASLGLCRSASLGHRFLVLSGRFCSQI